MIVLELSFWAGESFGMENRYELDDHFGMDDCVGKDDHFWMDNYVMKRLSFWLAKNDSDLTHL